MQYVQEAIDTNWVAPLGPNVNGFENQIAAKLESKAALTTQLELLQTISIKINESMALG